MKLKQQIKEIIHNYQHFLRDLNDRRVFEKILTHLVELTGAERASIFIDPRYQSGSGSRSLKAILSTGLRNHQIVIDVEHGIVGHVFKSHESYVSQDVTKDPYFYGAIDRETGYSTRSTIAVPLWFKNEKPIGVLQVLNKKEGPFSEEDKMVVELISTYVTMALDSVVNFEQMVESENVLEHTRGQWDKNLRHVVLRSTHQELQKNYDQLQVFAQSDSTVLIRGESGTGKEVITQLIHQYSHRSRGPLVAINCAAIPEQLFEAELFGVSKGAATGTLARKGKIEMAHNGTLFLDEIGEMPIEMQSKLLRVLQDHRLTRLGQETQGIEIDFRLVCATNRDLKDLVKQGLFREDLYYRINVIDLELPPLRERVDDLEDIAKSILRQLSERRGWAPKALSSGAIEKLKRHWWPGNIRELQNRLEHACIISSEKKFLGEDDFTLVSSDSGEAKPLSMGSENGMVSELAELLKLPIREAKNKFELQMVEKCLLECEGNKTEAARRLGITREGLRKILSRNEAA